MTRRHLGRLGIALLALLGFPSTGHASIWDFIWTLSGPQMMGFPVHCEYDLENRKTECREFDRRFVGQLKARQERRVWLSIDTGPYFSTGKNSENIDFEAFRTWMVVVEPMVEIRSLTSPGGNFMLHHGLFGASYDVLFGPDFDTFDKMGLKFRPVGVTIYKKINASFTMRWYPHGFTSDEFGIGPRLPNRDRDSETVYGFNIGVLW